MPLWVFIFPGARVVELAFGARTRGEFMVMAYQQKSAIRAGADASKIDPGRAAAGVARWRRAVAETLGQDPGIGLDEPRRQLVMLKVFGSTKRLADLCLRYPAYGARALQEGPRDILDEAAADLTALTTGVGGPDALHGALAPINARAEIAISLAEISNDWSPAQANAARVALAERLVETAVGWLIRGAVSRGELPVTMGANSIADGVFVLAGGDFAHEDLSPQGPLDMLVIYDQAKFDGPQINMAQRAFIRIGAELREAFEGKTGDFGIFSLRTPMGSGVNGAGLVETMARMQAAFADPQRLAVKRWVATARVVAGNRSVGGAFLEGAEEAVWATSPGLSEMAHDDLEAVSSDPRAEFRAVANLLRWSLGKTRPVFRAASTNHVFTTAALSSILPDHVAERLCAGNNFVQMVVSRSQAMTGMPDARPGHQDEETALAALCGYDDLVHFSAVRAGVLAEARNALARILSGPKSDFDRYTPASQTADDIDKLEDLGFRDGETLSDIVEGWAALCRQTDGQRFSAIAPGLLTAFGETQRPDMAVKLFDRVLLTVNTTEDQGASPVCANDALIDALGCFSAAIAPLTENSDIVQEFFQERGAEVPANGREWITRFPPPRPTSRLSDIKDWRDGALARIALYLSARDITFSAAADILAEIHRSTMSVIFEHVRLPSQARIALHVFDDARFGLPGGATVLGFIGDEAREDNEAVARKFLDALSNMGAGVFSICPDVSHRPSGSKGRLVPDIAAMKGYIQSEAVAHDQVMLARARVVAGDEGQCEDARRALRTSVANPRRADILFRDLDRARAQRIRQDKAGCEWDIDAIEGGALDVDLIIATLIYRHAAALPSIQSVSADVALDLMVRADLVGQPVAETLKAARLFWLRLGVLTAMSQWTNPQTMPVRKRFAALIARAAEVETFAQVRPLKRGYADEVIRLYAQIVLGRPSMALVANG